MVVAPIFLMFGSFLFINSINAHPGNTASDGCHYCWTNCSSWGEVYGTRHCHGGSSYSLPSYNSYSLPSSYSSYSSYSIPTCPSNSYYSYLDDACECNYGYVADGNRCISGNSYCWNNYGYNSDYNSLNKTCECDDDYYMKETYGGYKCESMDSYCQDNYGYNSKYDSLSDFCECKSGYEMTQKSYGSGLECKSCFSKYGLHSSYNYLTDKCECDDEYTLKDGECVEKQHNVYFYLKELNTDDKEAIIKSTYDNKYYHITYGYGCYNFSFKRYLQNNVVVNLGTDYDLDRWDYIVLYDDDETCDIKSVEKVDSSFTLEEEDENFSYYNYIDYTLPKVLGELTSNPLGIQSGWLIKNKKYVETFYVDENLCLHWIINEEAAYKHFGDFWWQKIKDYDNISNPYKFCDNLE